MTLKKLLAGLVVGTVLLWVGNASAAFISVEQDAGNGALFTVFFHSEEDLSAGSNLLNTLAVPLLLVGDTCAAGGGTAGCMDVDLSGSRYGLELPGALGGWTSQTEISALGGGAFQAFPNFGIEPGIELGVGDVIAIGSFMVASGTDLSILIGSGAYNAADLANAAITLSQAQGTVLFQTQAPEPAAILLLGIGLAGLAFVRRTARA